MTIKIIGAILILICCGGFGFSIASNYKKEERCLQCLTQAIDLMICELEYRVPPLPVLVRSAGDQVGGSIGKFFLSLASRLEEQTDADASACTAIVLKDFAFLPLRTRLNLQQLGLSLGRFALSGQVSCLQGVSQLCQRDLQSLATNRDARLRNYRTLGLCAGAALIILFL